MEALTQKSMMLMQIMFSEPFIKANLIDDSEKNIYKRVDIDPETCEVVLGKTSHRWWNRLIGSEKVISFETFVFKVVGAYAGKEGAIGDIVAKGLADDAVRSIIIQGRSNDMVDRLFIVGYLAVPTAFSCTEINSGVTNQIRGNSENNVNHETRYIQRGNSEVNLNVNCAGKRHTFVLPDTGEALVEVEIGPTEVNWLGRLPGGSLKPINDRQK